MNFDIEEEHFTVFNLLLLLLVWANTCYLLVVFFKAVLPMLVTTLLVITGLVLTVAMMIITLYVSIKWVRHHNLGWWFLIGVVILFIIAWSFEATVRNIFIREQMFKQQELR